MLQAIEELTKKTGNYKSFKIFVKMLLTSLTSTDSSVLVDLLSSEDLDKKRAKPSRSAEEGSAKNKRYIILTYVSEFDRWGASWTH